ncbi:TraR/DksA family transcriptional regulator [Geodermatophilus maliterrae]|uniref:TraR/DksA family transcriptional regulator n=1 Tax=Geodermatophilus maliterrae TaxID=3162531 RepID=A0ABV3XG14_9ACTN
MSTTTTPSAPTATAFEPFRALLQTQRADCLQQRELALAETATSVPDPVATSRAATLLRTVEEIDAALDRLDAGTYGTCVHCGSAIPRERLESRPFAAACVSCQQAT